MYKDEPIEEDEAGVVEEEKEENEEDEDDVEKLMERVVEEDKRDNQSEALFTKVVSALSMIQNGESTGSMLEEIMDDDIKSLLVKISPLHKKTDTAGIDLGSMFGGIADGSKICNLAKEISEEIDISNLKIDKPEDIMKMMDFSGSNNVMGDIIKKVSTKITDKISNGELKHDELLNEAMSMMGMMGKGLGGLGGLGDMLNNPMVSEIMKSMKKGKPMQTRTDVVSKQDTRARLRKKLEERRNKTSE
jgi:hypothetical protein